MRNCSFFAITGSVILNLFNISIDSLRIAGGLLLFSIAFDTMHAKVSRESIPKRRFFSHRNVKIIVLIGGTETIV